MTNKTFVTHPVFEGLPEYCWTTLPHNEEEMVVVHKGVLGYSPQNPDNEPWGAENKDILNKRLGVTKAQEKAMLNGSMFGWDAPAANPALYDEDGKISMEKLKAWKEGGQ